MKRLAAAGGNSFVPGRCGGFVLVARVALYDNLPQGELGDYKKHAARVRMRLLAKKEKGVPDAQPQKNLESLILFYWMNHPQKKWLNWVMGIAFLILMSFPIIGLLVGQPK